MSSQIVEELNATSLAPGLGQSGLELLAGCVSERNIPEGHVLFRQGDASSAAFVIRSGSLIAELVLPNGVSVEMARMGAGSVVGELCLVQEGARSLAVRSLEPTRLLVIERTAFEALRQAGSPAAYRVIRNICVTLCDRLRTTNSFIEREFRHEPQKVVEAGGPQGGGFGQRARQFFNQLLGRES